MWAPTLGPVMLYDRHFQPKQNNVEQCKKIQAIGYKDVALQRSSYAEDMLTSSVSSHLCRAGGTSFIV